ncbi:MAG: hypothetical protein ABSH44_07640 [Bryobacteraceae bacterium]|jgi:hypothetical protein
MYFFHDGLLNYALEVFPNYHDAGQDDSFFELFVPGNTRHFAERPFERFSDYEELLQRLLERYPGKYQEAHKGTPFYYMSWLAFDLRNYEKALFYIDAAISEDVRNNRNPPDGPLGWKAQPGARFLLLDPAHQAAGRTIVAVKDHLQSELTRFNGISNQKALDIETSWRAFVADLLVDADQRTVISALYVFLLEFHDRLRELRFREGSLGGSNQPFTVHLFTGGLIFESLLKRYYPTSDSGQPNRTLGGILKHTQQFLRDFSLAQPPEIFAESLDEIHAAIQGGVSIETAFSITAMLRNTTGHNLVWDNIFSAPAKYVDLFQQVMNALLFIIARKLR